MLCKLAISTGQNAANDPRLVGVLPTWITALVNLLLPGITGLFPCLGPNPPAAEVQDHLEAAHGAGIEYSESATGPLAHQARREGRRQGDPLNQMQARAIAEHTLETARIAQPDVLQEALSMQPGV